MEQISDRRDVQEPANRYELACRAAGIGVWELHVREGRLAYSDIARSIFGFSMNEILTRDIVHSTIHPDDLEVVLAAARRAMDPSVRSDEHYIYRIRRFDTGEPRWLRAHGIAQFDGDGPDANALLYAGSLQDITDRERTRQALAASEERLRLAVDAAGMAVWDLDLETNTVARSAELNRMLGFPEDAHPTIDELRSRYAPGERERIEQEGAAAQARGETSLQTRVRYLVPGRGEVTYVLRAALAQTPSPNAAATRVVGILFDATDQARAEHLLNTMNQELRHRLKNMVQLAGAFARQTWHGDGKLDTYLGRIRALTLSTELMFGERETNLRLGTVIERSLTAFRPGDRDPFTILGPDINLQESLFTGIALVLHELATNALKHGALSTEAGRVGLNWTVEDDLLRIVWRETGGPRVEAPQTEGFGLKLLTGGALPPPHSVDIAFLPEGLVATIRASLLG